MPRNPPPKDNRWQKGQSGNPSGKPKGIYTRDEIRAVVSRAYRMTKADLKRVIEDPESTMLEIHVASIMAQGVKKGEFYSFDGLMNRTVGKVKDELEVTALKPFVITKSDGSQVVCGAEVEKKETE